MSKQRRYRCAIYTRKSHEEGLDQEVNSLNAQREACEAYIHSQAGLGWELSSKTYDDGGISGGHMERDGLQNLIRDIKAGRIDIVVFYKVDRLTRSITDFGKLVDVFDEHEVSFVSVTQAFNTTNSMGRLTLNVLLSFAQFEREVTAERIRDKIAGSKQKGMWMGGRVPLGYCNHDKKLIVDEDEAKIVRLIFDLYAERKNVRLAKAELDKRNIRTRQRTNRNGDATGGNLFSAGNLYAILKNPIYAGKIKHKEKVYPGNHASIIEPHVWHAVQTMLSGQTKVIAQTAKHQSPALLAGLLFDDRGNRLIPHHTNKKGKKYHYYVGEKAKNLYAGDNSDNPTRLRLPMKIIEDTVRDVLVDTLKSDGNLLLEQTETIDAAAIQLLSETVQQLAETISTANHSKLKGLYRRLLERIEVDKDHIVFFFNPAELIKNRSKGSQSQEPIQITKPICIRRRGQELRLVIGGQRSNSSKPDEALIRLIAKAHLLKRELESSKVTSIKEFASKHGMDHGDAKNLMPLCYLAPSIIEDVLAGLQPPELTAKQLRSAQNLPIMWNEQRLHLGYAP